MIAMNEKEKAVIEAVERHNEYCCKVENMGFDALNVDEPNSVEIECIDTMRQGNVASGVELCCKMRELRIDAVVDMLWGYVLPRSEADDSEIDGKQRYLTFCWAEET